MNHFSPLPLALLLCGLLNPSWVAAAGFQAGAAKVKVTPEHSVRLSGYGSRTAVAEGVDQDLFARALVLKDEAGVLSVFVSVDAINIPLRVRDRVVGDLRWRTGIYHVRLAVCATHTHYGPVIDGSIRNIFAMSPAETKAAKTYTDQLVKNIVTAIDTALAHLEPVQVLHGKGTAAFARNRRTAGGPVDHDVPVLAVKRLNGELKAALYAYSCHATTIPAELNRVCGDWPGYSAEGIEAAHPGAIALPVIACGADANPQPRGELGLSKQYGRELALAVEKVLTGPLKELPSRIDAQLESVELRFARLPTEAELKERLVSGPPHVQRLSRLLLDELAAKGRIADTYHYPVQVFAFGDALTMVFLAGEVVVDYAFRLRRELAPREVWVTAYANDCPGYIASKRVLGEGGYEVDDSMVWYGQPSRWDDSVEDVIVEKVKQLAGNGSSGALKRMQPPPPRSPQEALAAFQLPPGLRIELAAAEPNLVDPVQIAFDEQGRMYAAEMRDYPEGPAGGKPAGGSVRVLEDADGDGYFERSSVLADRLPFASGVTCSQGGVFVTTMTEILYLKDTDGDGKADLRQPIYTGFSPGNSQHLVNSLEFGPDGWIYVNGGDAANVHCVARSGIPDLSLSRQSFRFHPVTYEMRVTTGYRGGFGITFDGFGSRFVCDNQTHAVHVVFEREDLERASHVRIDETMNKLSGAEARVYPISKVLERFNDPQDYGRFSSACGVHIYDSEMLGADYRGSLLACEPVSNLVRREVLTVSGASYTAHRGEKEAEFLASNDHWFRPVNVTTGPDGALYVVDMYRAVIEHPEWIPDHVKKELDVRAGGDRGRVWRVVSANAARSPSSAITAASAPEEILSANSWRRSTARRLLLESGGAEVVARLVSAFYQARAPAARLEVLRALAALDRLPDAILDRSMTDADPGVRALAVREIVKRPQPAMAHRLAALARDNHPRVRFQVALAAGRLGAAERGPVLGRVVERDYGDGWTRQAVLLAAGDLAPILAAVLAGEPSQPERTLFVRQLSALAGARGDAREIVELLGQVVTGSKHYLLPAVAALLRAIAPGQLASLLDQGAATPELRARLTELLTGALERVRDETADLQTRLDAIELVGRAGISGSSELLISCLDSALPPELQAAAIRELARSRSPAGVSALIDAFERLTPRLRGEIVDALLPDEAGVMALLAAIESGRLHPRDIDLARRQALLGSGDAALRERSAKALAVVSVDVNRVRVIERYAQALASTELQGPADLRHGEALFLKNCAVCHRVGDRGIPVGADLSGMRNRGVDALLVDILDPNRAVAPEFVSFTCVKKDGQVLTGLLASETPSSVVLRRAEGKSDSILRREIAELKSTGESVMPQGFEDEIDPRGLRDVIAYVRGGFEELERAGVPAPAAGPEAENKKAAIAGALTFHVSFDVSADADFARGDPGVATGKELGKDARPGLTTGNVVLVPGRGRHGGAIEFLRKDELFAFYKADKNVAYARDNWSGTISFWLSLNPDQDLAPGYVDPLLLTERGWNDGAFFIDFSRDDTPRHLRLGAFADRDVWDPKKREWDAVPAAERPMVDVARPPFGRGQWTQVTFTWERFNSGKDDGVATLYLNGERQGALPARRQTFTWDPARVVLQFGIYYTGLFDDLAVFDRALAADEVRELHRLEGGIKSLRK